MSTFKTDNLFTKRKDESARIRLKYPDRCPVICEPLASSKLVMIDNGKPKRKYLTPMDLTMSQFLFVIRKRVKLDPSAALYIFINNSLPSGSATMGEVYKEFADEDGFLYISYGEETTFG